MSDKSRGKVIQIGGLKAGRRQGKPCKNTGFKGPIPPQCRPPNLLIWIAVPPALAIERTLTNSCQEVCYVLCGMYCIQLHDHHLFRMNLPCNANKVTIKSNNNLHLQTPYDLLLQNPPIIVSSGNFADRFATSAGSNREGGRR